MKNQLFRFSSIAIFALVIQFLTVSSLFAQVKKEDRTIKSFQAIEVSGGFEVTLTQGSTESLQIEAEEDVLPDIVTRVEGNTLKIYVDRIRRISGPLKATLTFKELNSIDISGAVTLDGTNEMKFDQLDFDGSGATEVDMILTANKLSLDLSGASKMMLRGAVNKAEAECSGASKLKLGGLEVKQLSFECSGASDAEVWATESLSIECSGASSVRYKGNPEKLETDASGASSIRKY